MSRYATQQAKIQYQQPGTLLRPKIIGRVVRLLLGILCLYVVSEVGLNSSVSDLLNPSWWFLIGIGLLIITYVVNIGFGISIGTWPRNLSIALFLLAAGFTYLNSGALTDPTLWLITFFWLIYVYLHLGISFLLSAVLATPGCEMSAIRHLLGLVIGKDPSEHYCPAFIDNLDRWEHGRTQNDFQNRENLRGVQSKDLLGNGGQMLLIYGVPFVVIQVAGNFGSFQVATLIPALMLLGVSFICLINIVKCKRVHCYFICPWFLAAGLALTIYGFRLISFGPDTWSLLVNAAIVGGVCISMHMEMTWGKYFSKS